MGDKSFIVLVPGRERREAQADGDPDVADGNVQVALVAGALGQQHHVHLASAVNVIKNFEKSLCTNYSKNTLDCNALPVPSPMPIIASGVSVLELFRISMFE